MNGQNTVSTQILMGYVDRIERLEGEKSDLVDDIRAVYAEAKAAGLTPKYIRSVIKRRRQKPGDVQEDEAMLDMYFHAAGLAKETPLFKHVGALSVDRAAREQVIDAFKALVPNTGDIIVRMGSQPVRLWRDKDGEAHAEDWEEPVAAPPTLKTKQQQAARPAPPDVDDDGAFALGREAAKGDKPIIDNPFPWDDKRRARWDEGWRREAGSDGMGPDENDGKGGGA